MRTIQELRAKPRVERVGEGALRRGESWAGRTRILVVDDEPMLGRTLSFMLEDNHDVVVASGGGEALAELERDADFDLVLCDLDMPGVNGCAVHKAVSSRYPGLLPRFVLMTGGACTSWAEDFLAGYSGAQLEKPFTAAEVENVLERVG